MGVILSWEGSLISPPRGGSAVAVAVKKSFPANDFITRHKQFRPAGRIARTAEFHSHRPLCIATAKVDGILTASIRSGMNGKQLSCSEEGVFDFFCDILYLSTTRMMLEVRIPCRPSVFYKLEDCYAKNLC